MLKNIAIILIGLISGIFIGFLMVTYIGEKSIKQNTRNPSATLRMTKGREVLGFLPYWLLDKARNDYSGYITTLDYFSLTIDKDGTILKSVNPTELEPGYYALTSGKVDPFFESAKLKNIKLSLTIFNGDQDAINSLISDPIKHAQNLVNDVSPIMAQYGFSDLNMDIEPVGTASPSAQINYQAFIREVRQQLAPRGGLTMSMDVIPVDFIKNDHLAIPANLAPYLDKIIIMAYDFHSPSSFVTGPVAPLYGAGTVAEFDTEVTINAALKKITPDKILLGAPFYGYSWETIDNFERAAVIPTTALIVSNRDLVDLLSKCSSCSALFDTVAREKYIIYKNTDSNTYQQFFYPDTQSVQDKIDFVKANNLGGLAIWALGYEGQPQTGESILDSLPKVLPQK